MKITKYRGWNTNRNIMISAEELGKDELTLNPDGRGFVNVSSSSTRFSQYMNHIIPLEFTGLEDKNGKEIYDGDIVKDTNYTRNIPIGVIKWFDKPIPGFSFQIMIGYNHYDEEMDNWDDLEVIGNIYENPELLKKVHKP